jgi:predicted phosphoribosyltransferase
VSNFYELKKGAIMFKDRYDAANQLVSKLSQYKNNSDVVIYAIPRGGLELGYVLAKELHAPLDVVFSKKIGAPGNPELAIGAVSLTQEEIDSVYANNPNFKEYLQKEKEKVRALLQKRYEQYRGQKEGIQAQGKIAIVVDDGIATGRTMQIALQEIKKQKPKKIILAVPVAPADTVKQLEKYTDEIICLLQPISFYAVGQFYQQFQQVSDEQAIKLLRETQK